MSVKPRLHEGPGVDPISDRHRRYGYGLPATDLDFVMLEYGNGHTEPVAIIEYKRSHRRTLSAGEQNSVSAIGRLAERAGIPAFTVTYDPDAWTFIVHPSNALAAEHDAFHAHAPIGYRLGEAEFVEFLYGLRGKRPPMEVIARCL